MLQEFISQNYLIIEQNIVTNIVYWDGDTTQWTPPVGSIALVQATIPAMVWEAIYVNEKVTDWVLTEQMGQGQINFTWDGTNCITNEPKPSLPTAQIPADSQPTTSGTTTI